MICSAFTTPATDVRDYCGPSFGGRRRALRETIHTAISESEGRYVAESLEVAVVAQRDAAHLPSGLLGSTRKRNTSE